MRRRRLDHTELETQLRSFQLDIWKNHDHLDASELAHYTSAEGALGIIRTGEFWLFNVMAQKDPERKYLRSIFDGLVARQDVPGLLKRLCGDSEGDLFGLGRVWDMHISCFCSAAEREQM